MVKKKRGRKKEKIKISKKEPTEKELFEIKVEELRQEFETSVARLLERSADLSSARDLLERQVDSKLSCVSYLQRVLKREFQRRLAIQERLQTECDLAELMEGRALGKFAASDRSSEVARSLFLQQKMELKGKLSLLEELRLERNSQRTHLRRAEDALEERASALRAKGREEDSNQADRLLCNRENFMGMCNTTRAEWKSAFDLRLPVHARRQLKENVRLRSECEETTEYLLSEQGRNRALRTQQKAMDLEEEIQESADKYEARRLVRQEEKIRRMAQILLLSSLLMGTSFLSEVPEEGGSSSNSGKSKSEATSYLSNHPLLTGAAAVRSPGCAGDVRRGQYAEDDEEDDIVDDRDDRAPFGRAPFPRRRAPSDTDNFGDECLVRFGLHYSSCFSKSKDFDDKLDQLQHHVQSWPRGGGRGSTGSPCSTLQLLAKVKSSPLFERCQGNQYVVRTPYHMYNVKGELRYIVQDPPNLEQCYLEAQCSIPGDLCRGYLGGSYRGRSQSVGRCESKHCHHTLLSWDPESPDAGTFFDVFEYSCCCSCQLATHRQHSSQQVVG